MALTSWAAAAKASDAFQQTLSTLIRNLSHLSLSRHKFTFQNEVTDGSAAAWVICLCVCWQDRGVWLTAKVGFTPNNITHRTMATKPIHTACACSYFMPILHFCHISPWLVCPPSPPLPSCSPHGKPPHPPHLISPLHLVTMQIYLSPLARKTGSSEAGKFVTTVPASGGSPPPAQQSKAAGGGSKSQGRKSSPTFTLNLQKSTNSQSQSTAVLEEGGYKSPLKSPSQYFQICYWRSRQIGPKNKSSSWSPNDRHNPKGCEMCPPQRWAAVLPSPEIIWWSKIVCLTWVD